MTPRERIDQAAVNTDRLWTAIESTRTAVSTRIHPPRVLVDQSHDMLFLVLHLGTYLKTRGFMGTFSHASLEPRIYQNCDVIITHQSWSDVPYTSQQIHDLKEFVARGGGLLLIGYGPGFTEFAKSRKLQFGEWPLNKLALEFGFQFESDAGGLPYVIAKHRLTSEVSTVTHQDKNPRVGLARIPPDADVLVSDSLGKPVLAIREVGKGRVGVLTEYRFIKTIDDSANALLFAALFHWLGENSKNRSRFLGDNSGEIFPGIALHKGYDYEMEGKPEPPNWNGGPDFIWPEIQDRLASFTLQYSASMQERANYLLEKYPLVYQTIFELFGVEPVDEIIIEALPSAGGGYHWTKFRLVAIGALASDTSVLAIMGHEMVHAWGLPTPQNFAHGWTTFTDDYVSEKLGLRSRAVIEKEWNKELGKVKEIDPDLDSLDITTVSPDPDRQRILDKKVGWILKELDRRYGRKFFAKLVGLYRKRESERIRQNLAGNLSFLPINDFIYYASVAADEDLFPWFKSLGTTVLTRPIENP